MVVAQNIVRHANANANGHIGEEVNVVLNFVNGAERNIEDPARVCNADDGPVMVSNNSQISVAHPLDDTSSSLSAFFEATQDRVAINNGDFLHNSWENLVELPKNYFIVL